MKKILCAFYTLPEFRELLNSLYDEPVYVDAALDGLYVGLGEDDIPAEDLHARLAKALDVDVVTSVHIDDYEPCGVWVAYKDRNVIDTADYIAAKLWCKADLEGVLKENCYKGTPDEVAEVCNIGMLDALNDATDSDWEIIHQAVCETKSRGLI